MRFRPAAWISLLVLGGGLLLGVALYAPTIVPAAYAQPPFQRATVEPTKPPYVFPTPIFIPTYPGQPSTGTATPVSSHATAASSGERTYTVVAGDNPWTISTKVYGVGTKSDVIMQANGIADPTKLKIGMVLKIPATDATGQALPIPVPTLAATPVPPDTVATALAQASPTPATPVGTPTPVPSSSGGLSNLLITAASVLVNLLALVFFLGAVAAAILAWLMYRQKRRLAEMNVLAKRIRVRKLR